ncbi:hypothetical protein KY290_024868 [Solanum tuberosum]|uniref:Peroxidase n=1 Tax=Solanum tuberosum TaxID=4113 RepID=A0ABQ7UTX4_SOLTU|nr:hypothetical protein KY290_024868 [Solanum tuberosum]
MGSVATFQHNLWIGYHVLGIFRRLFTDLAKKISDRSNSMVSQFFQASMSSPFAYVHISDLDFSSIFPHCLVVRSFGSLWKLQWFSHRMVSVAANHDGLGRDIYKAKGCDGSVLLNSTKGNKAEKDEIPNQSLRGFQVIDATKSALEKEYPGIVSCSDILALTARDAVSMINGPTWPVPLGRRDGRVLILSEASKNLPTPFVNFTTLQNYIWCIGPKCKRLCCSISRLYNLSGKGDMDPNMDQNYIDHLKIKCKSRDVTTIVEMDPVSFKSFDTHYDTMVSKRRGLFASDAALLTNTQTKDYVLSQLYLHGSTFFKDFGESMVKMRQIGVLTGKAGEIRKHRAFRN